MRQRKPDRAELIPSGIARVQEAAGDVDVGDRVAVEEDVSAAVEPGEGKDGDDEGKGGDQDAFVLDADRGFGCDVF